MVIRNFGIDKDDIDKDVKNKWVWEWLLKEDVNDDYLSEYIQKINQPEVAICTWCKEHLHCSSSRKKSLKLHAIHNKEKHLKKKIFMKNTTIPTL